jgi:hypothetical protein
MPNGLAGWWHMSNENRRIFLDRYFPETTIGGMTKEEIVDAPIGLVPGRVLEMVAALQRNSPGGGEREI